GARPNFPLQRSTMKACVHLERMLHRNSITVPGESVAGYALLKLIPSGGGTGKPMGLNLALVLDVSGSMYEEDGTGQGRLKRIQDATRAAVGKLQPDDSIAIVAFAHNALVLLPSTRIAEKDKIDDVINRIDMFDVDPGGTAMDEGIALGMAEVEKTV